jgi:serine protease Do
MKKLGLFLTLFAASVLGVLAAFKIDRMTHPEPGGVLSTDSNFPYGRTASFVDLPAGPADFRAAAKRVMPSIVSVDQKVAEQDFMTGRETLETAGSGSGVIISSDGLILTNNHVIEGAQVVVVRTPQNKTYSAKVVGADPRSDLAVLKINATNLTPAILGDSDKVDVGQWVLAVGNPLGYSNTVSAGIISSLKRTLPVESGAVYIDALQTDAAVNPGNSGGALTNDQGEVIGINSAIATRSGGSVGLGFAIPINRAKKVVHDIVNDGRVRYGDPGFTTFPQIVQDGGVQDFLQQHFSVAPPQSGLVINELDPNGPAAKAGIQRFDVLLSVDNVPMKDPIAFVKFFTDKKPGDQVHLRFWDGKDHDITLSLEDAVAANSAGTSEARF